MPSLLRRTSAPSSPNRAVASRAAVQSVGSGPADEEVLSTVANEKVVAGAAGHVLDVTRDGVSFTALAVVTELPVEIDRDRRETVAVIREVEAAQTVQCVGTEPAVEEIVLDVTREPIGARTPPDPFDVGAHRVAFRRSTVVAGHPVEVDRERRRAIDVVDDVVSNSPGEDVRAGLAGQEVVGRPSPAR